MRAIGGVASAAPAVALDEILTLIGHAVLDGDAAAQRRDPLDDSLRDRLGVVEEPVAARSSGISWLTASNTSRAREMVSS